MFARAPRHPPSPRSPIYIAGTTPKPTSGGEVSVDAEAIGETLAHISCCSWLVLLFQGHSWKFLYRLFDASLCLDVTHSQQRLQWEHSLPAGLKPWPLLPNPLIQHEHLHTLSVCLSLSLSAMPHLTLQVIQASGFYHHLHFHRWANSEIQLAGPRESEDVVPTLHFKP